jgi:voltage-gated potassium channel|tara:strand:+ start:453 stop:1289 length:837 start_codon:yes stop_codon:yes gene_type:complete
LNKVRQKIHDIIYEADTPAGQVFDISLIIVIIISVILVALESIDWINEKYHAVLNVAEWIITALFTIEYILRIYSVKKPKKYIFSFYGIIDLLATIPKYLSLIFVGAGVETLMAIRALRILRIFRVLHISRYIGESNFLVRALLLSRAKIVIFLLFVVIMCIVFGTIMYLVEGPEAGFNNIPTSIYWCIVTITTVGYGDIAPITELGQFIASLLMILGYGIIAVPTGIISAEMVQRRKEVDVNTKVCAECMNNKHKDNAIFCGQCGSSLNEDVHRVDE